MYLIDSLKLKVKDIDDLDENWQARYLVKMCMCAKFDASRSSRLFAVHNRTFRYRTDARTNERTNARTNEHTACRHALFNSVETV